MTHANLLGMAGKIPHIGRYGGHSWNILGSRNLDAQAVFPHSTDILASKHHMLDDP